MAGDLSDITLRDLQTVPAAAPSALQSATFADDAPSRLLAEVLASKAVARGGESAARDASTFGVAAVRGDVLVGRTQGDRAGRSRFCMPNSGVAATERRRGVYARLVQAVLVHAAATGCTTVRSHHAAANAGATAER